MRAIAVTDNCTANKYDPPMSKATSLPSRESNFISLIRNQQATSNLLHDSFVKSTQSKNAFENVDQTWTFKNLAVNNIIRDQKKETLIRYLGPSSNTHYRKLSCVVSDPVQMLIDIDRRNNGSLQTIRNQLNNTCTKLDRSYDLFSQTVQSKTNPFTPFKTLNTPSNIQLDRRLLSEVCNPEPIETTEEVYNIALK